MRTNFDAQLERLNTELTEMGGLCEAAIMDATNALLDHDFQKAEQAILNDEEIDQKESFIESYCLKMLLRQQPVARDLRTISAALKMITDMERIGDQASDIASISKEMDFGELNKEIHIAKMASATIKMVTGSVRAFVCGDLKLAYQVMDDDNVVDDLFTTIKNELIQVISRDQTQAGRALDVLMVSKYYERIGDHAVNLAEWVEFSITGVHKGLEPLAKHGRSLGL